MSRVIYLTHPQVQIDPNVPVPDWGLNAVGHARVAAITTAQALQNLSLIVSSAEQKAIETATPIAEVLNMDVLMIEAMHENDRSATGFLPPDQFEEMADAFFANPDQNVRGWESAQDAQDRIKREVLAVLEIPLESPGGGDILITGHGGVGTLLYCALSNQPISRTHDQKGGGGQWFAFDRDTLQPDGPWRAMETLI